MGTFILHPDRYIFRDKPLEKAAFDEIEQLMQESDHLLAAAYARGDDADDPRTKAGYRLRYTAKLLMDLVLERKKLRKQLQRAKAAKRP